MPSTPQSRLHVIGGIFRGRLRTPLTPPSLRMTTTTTTTTRIQPSEAESAITPVSETVVRTVIETEVAAPARIVTIADSDSEEEDEAARIVVISDSESEADGANGHGGQDANDAEDGDDAEDGQDVDGLASVAGGNAPPSDPPPAYSENGFPLKRKYLPTHPSDLLPLGPGPCFLLTRAQETGVYDNEDDLRARIAGLGRRAIWERRQDSSEARILYTAAYEAGEVFAEPLPGGPFVNNPFILVPAIQPPVVHRPANEGFLPIPDDLRRPLNMYKFYLVKRGEEVGIFNSWHEAAVRVDSLRGRRSEPRAAWKRYWSWEAALAAYTYAFYHDELAATPVVGGRFDIH